MGYETDGWQRCIDGLKREHLLGVCHPVDELLLQYIVISNGEELQVCINMGMELGHGHLQDYWRHHRQHIGGAYLE